MASETLPRPIAPPNPRRYHRLVCVCAGGLALMGGALALLVQPWLALLAVVGGTILALAPDRRVGAC